MSVLRRRRLTDHEEVDTEGSWAISYGDMITLLLTFFVLFYSTNKERDRLNVMQNSLLLALNKDSTQAPKPLNQAGQDPAMTDKILKQLDAKAHKVGSKLVVEFPHVSFFKLGAVKLTKEGRRQLLDFVKIYMPFAGNYTLSIRAFTDHKKVLRLPGRGYNDNLELSALRSVSAMRELQHLGIPLHRMRLAGYGELNLAVEDLNRAIASTPDYDANGMALARKVVLVIEPELKESL
jgi:flagellar motor protein MotB